MSITEMTKSLQFRSQAMAFANCLSGYKRFTVQEEVMFNFKKTFRKPNEKFAANKSNKMCTRCGGKPHSSRPCPVLSKKCNTCEKVGHFSKCLEANPNQIHKYNQQNNFAKQKKFLQSMHLYHRRWESFILRNKSLACLRHGNISQ